MMSSLPIGSLIDYALGDCLGNLCLVEGHKGFFYLFFLEVLTFRSVVHFEIIVYCMKYGLKFIFSAYGYLVIPIPFLKKTILPP